MESVVWDTEEFSMFTGVMWAEPGGHLGEDEPPGGWQQDGSSFLDHNGLVRYPDLAPESTSPKGHAFPSDLGRRRRVQQRSAPVRRFNVYSFEFSLNVKPRLLGSVLPAWPVSGEGPS